MVEKTVRNWIDIEIRKLNESRQYLLKKVHNLESQFEYFSYIKDMTGYKLTADQGTEIGNRLNAKEFLSYLEFTNEILKEIDR